MSQLIKQMGALQAITGASVLSQNGYIQLGDVIIQWGLSDTVSPERGATVVFPIAFPNACFVVVPGTHCSAGAGSDVWGQVNSFNKTQFTWFAQASGGIVNMRLAWIAIGN